MKTNLEIIRDHYTASARRDLACMMEDVSPTVAWTEMAGFPCAGTWIGPGQVEAHVFATLARDWEAYTFTLEQLIDGGERIVGIGTYYGTFRQTGKTMKARVCHVWRLGNGKIEAFEQFTDTLLIDRAMQS